MNAFELTDSRQASRMMHRAALYLYQSLTDIPESPVDPEWEPIDRCDELAEKIMADDLALISARPPCYLDACVSEAR